jgi:hypothetical protein
MNLDNRRLVDALHPIIVEVGLLDAPFVDGDLAIQGCCEAENQPTGRGLRRARALVLSEPGSATPVRPGLWPARSVTALTRSTHRRTAMC